jgi:hypothetical protein
MVPGFAARTAIAMTARLKDSPCIERAHSHQMEVDLEAL